MEQKLIKQLQRFKAIEPRAEYTEYSFRLITAAPQHFKRSIIKRSVQEVVTLGVALVLASLLLLIMLSGFAAPKASFITENNPDFNINIGVARYQETERSRQEVALRLQSLEDSIMNISNGNRSQLLYKVSELRKALTK